MGAWKTSGARREGKEKGFTLLELVAALAIISFVVIAAYRLQHQGFRSFRHASLLTGAVLIAQEKFAEAHLSSPRAGRGRADGVFGESLYWEIEVSGGPREGVWAVRVRVGVEPRQSPIFEAVSYVAQP